MVHHFSQMHCAGPALKPSSAGGCLYLPLSSSPCPVISKFSQTHGGVLSKVERWGFVPQKSRDFVGPPRDRRQVLRVFFRETLESRTSAVGSSLSLSTTSARKRNSKGIIGCDRRRMWIVGDPIWTENSHPRNRVAGCAVPSTGESSQLSAKSLEERFGCDGVRFSDVAGMTIVELKVENRSSTRMVLQSAIISSYKPIMWHGAPEEMLHTQVSASDVDGTPLIRGGIGLFFCQCEKLTDSIFSSTAECWNVEDISGRPSQYLQVTLSRSQLLGSIDGQGREHSLNLQYVVTLSRATLSCALVITNTGVLPIAVVGAIQTHMAVSTVEGAFAVGLQGCKYGSSPFSPALSLPGFDPEIPELREMRGKQSFFSNWQQLWGTKEAEGKAAHVRQTKGEGDIKVERQEYAALYGEMNRLYTMVPDSFDLLDRGLGYKMV